MPKRHNKKTEFSPELLDELIAGNQTPEEFFGSDGLLKRLQGAVIERALGAELNHHMGYPAHTAAAVERSRSWSTNPMTAAQRPVRAANFDNISMLSDTKPGFSTRSSGG